VNFVVEQNRDAQLRSLLAIETGMPRDAMIPVLDYGGLPLTASIVVNAVTRHLNTPGLSPRPGRHTPANAASSIHSGQE
jgi:2-oxoglutarate ferredoxin oxidoreductase subunit alpha